MNTIPMIIESLSSLPECWLYQNNFYSHVTTDSSAHLPHLPNRYEPLLKELEISYRLAEYDSLEYWDASNYEENDLTLPLYIPYKDGTYHFVKNYTGKIPTANSFIAAKKLKQQVQIAVTDFEEEELNKKEILRLRPLLKGRMAVGILNSHLYFEADYVTKEHHLKILRVQRVELDRFNRISTYGTNHCVLFDVNKIELNSEIDLYVPKGKEGLFIGKNGWQVKEWCQKLGLKKINVVGI